MKIISGVYKITNIKNGKVYVGSAENISGRWINHLSELRKEIHHSKHLRSAWKKYGEENFKFEIIEIVGDIKLLTYREQYWIDYYESYNPKYGYNILPKARSSLGMKHTDEAKKKVSIANSGENHPNWGKHRSEETRRKIGLSQKGKIISEKTRKKMSAILKGRKISEETKKKIGLSKKGKHHSEETKKKMSLSHKGKVRSEEHKKNISLGNKGRKLSEENKKKISLSLKGRKFSEETRKKLSIAAKKRHLSKVKPKMIKRVR
jgi:group I intron endonuclease